MNPEIMLFDEPKCLRSRNGWRSIRINERINFFRYDNGMTMVIVTHEMAFAREIANRIIFMDEGSILEEGTPETIFNNPKNSRTKEFLSKVL